ARLRDRLHTTTIYVTHDQVEAMTLGDRVAVMRDGVVQQLDTPQTLYRDPANLFVAAFIGSPSMNLFEAKVEGGEVCFGEHRLPISPRHDLRAYNGRTLVLGIRPSDFQDASLWRDESRATMQVRVDLAEELGAEVNLIFSVNATPATTGAASAVSDDPVHEVAVPLVASDDVTVCTACVDPRTTARPGQTAQLSVDPSRFHYFDLESGAAVGVGGAVAAAS
ncbi:MAG: ABC transporter ATP-binding protein, partial [Gaiellales bacterium]